MNLIVIPFHDWNKCQREGFRTRDAHIIQEFGKHPLVKTILVINRPLSPLEMIKERIYRRNGEIRQVTPNIHTVDTILPHIIQPLFLKRNWIPRAYGHPFTLESVNNAVNKLGMKSYTVWSNSPIHVPLIKYLKLRLYVFDMTDNFLKIPAYYKVKCLAEYYDFCKMNADLITTNSPDNANWLHNDRADALCIPNGVDPSYFSKKEQTTPPPPDISSISRPIVGYAGKMQEMLDVELMENVVTTFQKVSFVFIGQLLNPSWMRTLWQHPNVYYLGDKHYSDLPAYLARFDLCMIPYSIERQHGVDPIKFYEYLATGKPVVTTDIGAVSRFRGKPGIYVARSIEEFKSGINEFLQNFKEGSETPKLDIPIDVTWSYKADQIIKLIQQQMQQGRHPRLNIGFEQVS